MEDWKHDGGGAELGTRMGARWQGGGETGLPSSSSSSSMVMERSGVTSILSTGSSPCTATQEMYPLIFSASLALFLSRYLTFRSLFASLAAASLACESSRATIVTVLSLLHVIGGLGESLTLISNLGDPTFFLLRIEVSSDQVVSGDSLSLCLKSPCLKSLTLETLLRDF